MDPLLARFSEIVTAADRDSDEDETFFSAIDEIRSNAISAFELKRLQSFYRQQPDIVKPAVKALDRARSFQGRDDTASLVFAAVASEVCVKNAILRPMVHGFVHQAFAAQAISDLVLSRSGWERFRKLLAEIMREKIQVDLLGGKIGNSSSSLWDGFMTLMKTRNKILHQAAEATKQEAEAAVSIGVELLTIIFPKLLTNIGLQIGNTGLIEVRVLDQITSPTHGPVGAPQG